MSRLGFIYTHLRLVNMANNIKQNESVYIALEILRRIPRRRKITANEIHQQLADAGIERSMRSVQRQLESLSMQFDIERDDRSKPYGYRWLANSQGLSVISLTPQESLLLRLAEDHLQNLLPHKVMRSMEGFFIQARQNLNEEENAKLERQWPKKIRVVSTSQPLLPPKMADGVFETVSEALYTNHWLNLEYKNMNGKRSEIKVMPLGMVQQGQRLYLVCRFDGYDNERNLALHRIISAEISISNFERPKSFNLKDYDEDGRFGFGEGEKITLSFTITAEAGSHLYETPLSKDQKITENPDGTLNIKATVVDSQMLEWWLRGFGEDVTDVKKTDFFR